MYTNYHMISLFSLHPLAIVICVVLDIKTWRIVNIEEFIPESHNREVQGKSRYPAGKPKFGHFSFPEEFIVFL